MGQGIPLHSRHLGAAVGKDHQHLFLLCQCLVHQRRKGVADPLAEIRLALPIGAGALAVGSDPRKVIRVVLHLDVVAPLKAAKAHLLQVLHRHQLCLRKQHLGGLPGTAQGGDVDHLGVDVGAAQLCQTLRRQGDVPLSLIAFFGIIRRKTMA